MSRTVSDGREGESPSRAEGAGGEGGGGEGGGGRSGEGGGGAGGGGGRVGSQGNSWFSDGGVAGGPAVGAGPLPGAMFAYSYSSSSI